MAREIRYEAKYIIKTISTGKKIREETVGL